ncbi:MAG: hypothetical protein U5P41_14500 [Gammaproteobacteria bacterium]|nr:hypothetical protein [Gammaproteobacteria bacterium]
MPENAGYGWLDLKHADSVAEISRYARDKDDAATAGITNSNRRRASLLGRGLLHYLAERMPAINEHVIARTEAGRPFLDNGSGNSIAFASISHSRDIVAAALDTRSSIGIDVEYCRPGRDFRRIAQRVFPADIAGGMISADTFYQAWTLYEAWGKANDLDHINPGRNGTLMRLLEGWLQSATGEENRDRGITFFKPTCHYAGCVFRVTGNVEAVHADNKIAL